MIYPLIGAVAFGASTTLRKAGLGYIDIPVARGSSDRRLGGDFLVYSAANSGRQSGVQADPS